MTRMSSEAVKQEIRNLTVLTQEHPTKLRNCVIQPEALRLVPEVMARKYMTLPLEVDEHVLQVAMANPHDIFALEALATKSQRRIEPEIISADEIQEAIDFHYKSYDEIEAQISNISTAGEEVEFKSVTATDAPVAKALKLMIDEGVKTRASDIHLEPQEDKMRIRYRIDGILHDTFSLPLMTAAPLVSRIKILANMNIADHHRPQDGQFSVKTKGRMVDIRVATMPTVYGEMAVLRLLDKARATLGLAELGFPPVSLKEYQRMLKVPYGMIMVSGPTGAGKTTTLYASVNQLDQVGRNIITIEDPVEYRFKNINQIQVNPKAAITFAIGLRSILRLDPDVILVGEIRDAETAGIAVQSALTGHLVLSSIHANDAVGVMFRLFDLGVEPFLVCSALIGVVAQRMVRRICPDCAEPVSAPLIERLAYSNEVGEERNEFIYGKGCKSCANTGYKGRVGIFEILFLSDEIRKMLLTNTTPAEIRNQAIREGMLPLLKAGMFKVKSNITTPSEVLRNAYFED